MMGRTHAASGSLAFAAAAPLLPLLGVHLSTVGLLVGVVVAGGGALLPDLDHPGSTASRALGPVSGVLSNVIAAVSGGHRQGTHSLLGVAAFTVATFLADLAGTPARAVVAAFLLVLASAGLHLRLARPALIHLTLCVVGSAILIATVPAVSAGVLPAAVAIGAAAHLAGDALTREGVPILWPVRRDRVHIATLSTGGLIEQLVIGPAMLVAAGAATWHLAGGQPAAALYDVVVHNLSGAG